MKAKFYTVGLASSAKASLAYASHRERCRLCQCDIPKGSLSVIGTSFHPLLGYVGGWFHQVCWIHRNFTVSNGRIIKMAQDKEQKHQLPLPIPELSDIGELLSWDYKHSDIVDKEVVILSVEQTITGYGQAYIGKCLIDGEEHKVLFGGEVLVQQIKSVLDRLPLKGTVKKAGKYFTF